jgi:adenylate kinase
MNEMIEKQLSKNNYLLDGYPRHIEQAKFLEKTNPPEKIIFLEIPESEVFKRLSKRIQCSKCGKIYGINTPKKQGICNKCGSKIEIRKDDTPESIKKRISIFKKEIKPILDFYKNRTIKINGNQEVNQVFNEITRKLEKSKII